MPDNDLVKLFDVLYTDIYGVERKGVLEVHIIDEGLICDLWNGDECVDSYARTAQELIDELFDIQMSGDGDE